MASKYIEQLRTAIDKKQIEPLQARLEKVGREGKRQTAPFRKELIANPKKPRRQSGPDHGPHPRRLAAERIDETYDVPLPTFSYS